MVESLKKIVQDKIIICENFEDKERLELISRILEDENCFKIMKTETAYKLLCDIGYTLEEAKDVYNKIMFI